MFIYKVIKLSAKTENIIRLANKDVIHLDLYFANIRKYYIEYCLNK